MMKKRRKTKNETIYLLAFEKKGIFWGDKVIKPFDKFLYSLL